MDIVEGKQEAQVRDLPLQPINGPLIILIKIGLPKNPPFHASPRAATLWLGRS
ncbi:unnamed protein product, partial [Dovyalis caffra]